MKGIQKSLSRTGVAIALGFGLGLGAVVAPSHAQYAGSAQSLSPNDRETEDINNFLNGTGDSTGSLFSVINRLQQLGGRTGQDFAADQDENLNSAVKDFQKKQQQKLLQNQGSTTPPVGASNPVAPVKP